MNFDRARLKSHFTITNLLLLGILTTSAALVLQNLGHSGLTYWDEGFHAIVARNLTKHPLKFTLYDAPWLPYDYKNWGENHIWLHKPPVAMWTICLSHFIFGIHTFALRLPSAISLALTVWITFRIASALFDKRAALIAAFLQAFNPFLFASVHGYRYSDHVDIALLLWVQVSCWLLLRAIQTGKRRNYILSGVTMGIAYLSKSYLALITFGIAFVVWLAARLKLIRLDKRVRITDICLNLMAAIGTVAPWIIYCLIRYPKEFLWEHKRVLEHLNTDIENWGASWDRPLFDYMPLFYPVFYAAVIAAVLCLIVVMFKRRQLPEFFILAWAIGVIVPHTLAETKTPSATMIAVPPLLICLAAVISRAWQRKDWLYTAIWSAAMLAITVISGGRSLVKSRDGFDMSQEIAPYIRTNFWIVKQLLGFGILLALFAGVYLLTRRMSQRNSEDIAMQLQKWAWRGARTVALGLALFYTVKYVEAAYRVTEQNRETPLYAESGPRLQNMLPENACFFLDDERVGAHFDLMYYAARSTYQIYSRHMKMPRNLAIEAKKARIAGAIPYLFSVKETHYDYPRLLEGEVEIGPGKKKRYRIFEITTEP